MSISRIQPRELAPLLANGSRPTLVDVRMPQEFAARHVQGAVNLPLDQVAVPAVAALRQGPGPVYLLCAAGTRALAAAERLAAGGMTEVVVVDGGTTACVAAALPLAGSGGKVFTLERQLRTIIGTGVLAGALLAWQVHPGWIGLSAFFGGGLLFAGLTDICPLAILLAAMPWNRTPVKAGPVAKSCCG